MERDLDVLQGVVIDEAIWAKVIRVNRQTEKGNCCRLVSIGQESTRIGYLLGLGPVLRRFRSDI